MLSFVDGGEGEEMLGRFEAVVWVDWEMVSP